jgi:hypothetical protein
MSEITTAGRARNETLRATRHLWQGVLEALDRMQCKKPDRGEDAVPQGLR